MATSQASFLQHYSVKGCKLLYTFEEKSIIALPVLMLFGHILMSLILISMGMSQSPGLCQVNYKLNELIINTHETERTDDRWLWFKLRNLLKILKLKTQK